MSPSRRNMDQGIQQSSHRPNRPRSPERRPPSRRDSPPPSARRSRSGSASTGSVSLDVPITRSPTYSRSSLTVSPTLSTAQRLNVNGCDRDDVRAKKIHAPVPRAIKPKRFVQDLSDGEEDVLNPPKSAYEDLVTDSDNDDQPSKTSNQTAAPAPFVDTSGSDEELEIIDEVSDDPVAYSPPVSATSASQPPPPRRGVSFDDAGTTSTSSAARTPAIAHPAARAPSGRQYGPAPGYRNLDPNGGPRGWQPGVRKGWVPQPPPARDGIGGPKRADQLARYLQPAAHTSQPPQQFLAAQQTWAPGMGSPVDFPAGSPAGFGPMQMEVPTAPYGSPTMPMGSLGVNSGPWAMATAGWPTMAFSGQMGPLFDNQLYFDPEGRQITAQQAYAMEAERLAALAGSMTPGPNPDGGKTPSGGRTPGGSDRHRSQTPAQPVLQVSSYAEYPDLKPDKRAEYEKRRVYLTKLQEGKPFEGRKTLRVVDQEPVAWYHDQVRRALAEGKDLDGDKHFVCKGTQDMFKYYLTDPERRDLQHVCKEIQFMEELAAAYLKISPLAKEKEKADRQAFVNSHVLPRVAILEDAASLRHPIWRNPPPIKPGHPLFKDLDRSRKKAEVSRAAKGKGKAVE